MLPRTIRAYEHERIRCGEPRTATNGEIVRLTEEQLDALARFNDAHDGRFFRFGYRSLILREYVGYLQVGDLAIEVLPKADRRADGQSGQLRWRAAMLEMLRVAVGLRLHSVDAVAQSVARSSLLEIFAARFLEEVDRLLREGLARGYRKLRSNGPVFRGRLLVSEQVRSNLVRADRFAVEHQAYDHEITVNHILRAALEVLAPLALPGSLRGHLDRVRASFPELSVLPIQPTAFDRIHLGRSTDRYREAIDLARIILLQQAPQLRSGGLPVIALLFDMNALWERFIARLLARSSPPDLEVSIQDSRRFWRVPGLPSRTVRPDIIVRRKEDGEVLLVGDTKWKVPAGSQPSDADLKQMFVYNEVYESARSVLIYPEADADQQAVDGAFTARSHRCGTIYVGLFDGGDVRVDLAQHQLSALLGSLSTSEHAREVMALAT